MLKANVAYLYSLWNVTTLFFYGSLKSSLILFFILDLPRGIQPLFCPPIFFETHLNNFWPF